MNVWLTQRQGEATRQGERVSPFIRAALGYLGLSVMAGAMLAINFATGWLGHSWLMIFSLHMAWAIIGWFTTLVIGVSYHMLPFFGLIEKKVKPRFRSVVRFLLHGAVVTLVAAIITARLGGSMAPILHIAALACIVFACCGFLWDSRGLFAPRTEKRMHPTIAYVRAAHICLLLVVSLLPPIWLGRWTGGTGYTVLALLAAGGWLSNTILGYLHRIVPFVVWHNKYWGRAQEPGVPAFRDMVPARFSWLGFWLYNTSLVFAILGVMGWVPVELGMIAFVAGSVVPIFVLFQVILR